MFMTITTEEDLGDQTSCSLHFSTITLLCYMFHSRIGHLHPHHSNGPLAIICNFRQFTESFVSTLLCKYHT